MPTLSNLIDRFLREQTEPTDRADLRALINAEQAGAADAAQTAAIDVANSKVDNTAYDATLWDGVLNIAPSKNAVRDVIAPIKTAVDAATSEPTALTLVKRDNSGRTIASRFMARNSGSFDSVELVPSGLYGTIGGGSFSCNVPPLPDATSVTLAITQSTAGIPDSLSFGSGATEFALSSGGTTIGATARTTFLAALGIPTYADLAAANVDLALGQIYFDTSLGTLNTATA